MQIRNHIPEAKPIVVLRNPVDRAYSNFLYQIRTSFETTTDFSQALREEDARISNNWRPFWHYKQMGFYYVQLNRYFQIFERSQIQVHLYEDFCDEPIKMRNATAFGTSPRMRFDIVLNNLAGLAWTTK